ncbi:glycoside hydrolase family 32 protein [Cellulomonas marina]|uniref:beta-fructofuranosidase n=1 Tax=Cellulomonas marina TaxID=988821 RepID=A0A1I0V4Z6_9CELL|nr:glycoside hydrolase family 32 protein [Cellulomonas marina]GIG28341.1 hypothetical protein Cma02nite_09410 [Cellulomonas marina]SFA71414.1 beta-fructofuranosidase [Cellulomonas marina]
MSPHASDDDVAPRPTAPAAAPAPALDPYPHLHLRPSSGWVNDPNGFLRHHGRWHLFYQLNPHSPRHADIHWGHASSTDLVRWEHEPVALAPRPDGPDANGCWSGTAVVVDDVPVLAYTAVRTRPESAGVVLATPDDPADPHLAAWTAEDDVVCPMPADAGLFEIRDPFFVTLGGHRWALQAGRTVEDTPVVRVFLVDDLHDWQDAGTLLAGTGTDDPWAPGHMWECPQLVRVDGAWVLVVSRWRLGPSGASDAVLGPVAAIVGDVHLGAVGTPGGGPRFRPRTSVLLDDGPDFYAPQALVEPDRVVLVGWTWEHRDAAEVDAAGWAGALTFPRELGVRDGHVLSWPAREVEALRGERLGAGTDVRVAAAAFEVLDEELASATGTGTELVLALDGPQGARVVWRSAGTGPVRVLVDGSVVEAFVDGRAHTVRAYPRPGETWHVRAAAPVVVHALRLPG